MTLLAWRRGGGPAGPVVVLLHGWAQDAGVWDAWDAPLADAGLSLLACDLPGHGGSAEFEAPRGADLARWSAEAIGRDLDALGTAAGAHLVGLAEGAMVAAHLAVGGGYGRTVLIDPRVEPPSPHAAEAAAALRDQRASVWRPEAADIVARARAAGGRHDRRTLADWLERASWPGPARLRAIDGPVLVVVGADDPERAQAPRLAALLGAGRLATVGAQPSARPAEPDLVGTVVTFLGEDGP